MSKPIDVDDSINSVDRGELPGWIADHLREYTESGGERGHMWDSSAAGGPALSASAGRRSRR